MESCDGAVAMGRAQRSDTLPNQRDYLDLYQAKAETPPADRWEGVLQALVEERRRTGDQER